MPESAYAPDDERTVRDLADAYVASLADLDPMVATMLGLESSAQGLPDLSPAGYQAQDELALLLGALGLDDLITEPALL
jgi:hypothetical protein